MQRIVLSLCLALVASFAAFAQQVWDFEYMNQLRTTDDPTIVTSRAAIARAADKLLGLAPVTVMNQRQVAPSGNPHDYFSMARYWWPNPKTPDHLPYIRKDGQNNPETEGLGREALSAFQKHTEVLALAYFYTGEEAYADKCWEMLRAWFLDKKTYMTPHMAYSQVVLGRDDNHGRHEGLLDTYSLLHIPDILHILEGAKSTKPTDVEAIRQWFADYVNWMVTNPQGIGEDNATNNHGTAYHIQVIVYAAFAGNDSLSLAYRNSFVERRIIPQVKPDGSQPAELKRTRALGYSVFNLTHYFDYVDLCYAAGYKLFEEDEEARTRILAAIDFIAPYLGRTVDSWPFLQINEWDKQQQNLSRLLRRAGRYFPDRGYTEKSLQFNTDKPSDRHWLY